MQRLAALVPRPRLYLIRFHGVLAPKGAVRSRPKVSLVNNQGPANPAQRDDTDTKFKRFNPTQVRFGPLPRPGPPVLSIAEYV